MILIIIILLCINRISSDTNITNLKGKDYILIETNPAFIFDSYDYLYHITNLTRILTPYQNVLSSKYNLDSNPEMKILHQRIKILIKQINPVNRFRRGLNALGTILKWITGTPDHDDEVEIQTRINQLIEGHNKQKIINSNFEKMLEKLNPKDFSEKLILTEVYNELNTLLTTINLAKNNNFLSTSLDLEEITEIIAKEKTNVLTINILEYAEIKIVKFKQNFVTVYKYPKIKEKCEQFYIHYIALCKGNQYVRINKCKDFMDQTICKQNKRDECTIQILEKNNAQCKMIKEKNPPFINYGNGNIIISGLNVLNNETLDGDFSIYFKTNITLNNEEYINIKETMVKILHNKHKENLDILEYLESQSEYKFNNLDEISSIFVPIEQNPIKATFITILIIILLITITKLLLEFRVKRRKILYQRALIQCQKDHEERKRKLLKSKL